MADRPNSSEEDNEYWYREQSGARQRKAKKSPRAGMADADWEEVPATKSASKLKEDLGYSEAPVADDDRKARAKAALEAMKKRKEAGGM